jgi:hypothetical protein
VAGGLFDLYAKCGGIRDACKAFSEVGRPGLVLWRTHLYLDTRCMRNSLRKHSHNAKIQMICSFVSEISACSNMSSASKGQQLHALVVKSDVERWLRLENYLTGCQRGILCHSTILCKI